MNNLINKLGIFGPLILIIASIVTLWNKTIFYYYYKIGIVTNFILNYLLKILLCQPRPNENIEKFNLAVKNFDHFTIKNNLPHDIFGMPSGHAQSVFFSTVYVFLVKKNIKIFILYLIISLITIYQRIESNNHTILQTIVGSLLGSLYAIIIYYLGQKNIIGIISSKKDDDNFFI